MPLSAVVYTSNESFAALRSLVRKRFEDRDIKPYTLSFPQKQGTGAVRFRATELARGALMPLLTDMVEKGAATLASPADRDVKRAAYGELLEDADRSGRVLTVQYASPTIVPVMGGYGPFPVVCAIFARYGEVWRAFSDVELPRPAIEAGRHVRVADFRISCAASPFGTGTQGWVTLEMEKGRTEEEIGLLNALVDFAFYCGTGAYAEEGLGQTRKIEPRRPK